MPKSSLLPSLGLLLLIWVAIAQPFPHQYFNFYNNTGPISITIGNTGEIDLGNSTNLSQSQTPHLAENTKETKKDVYSDAELSRPISIPKPVIQSLAFVFNHDCSEGHVYSQLQGDCVKVQEVGKSGIGR